MDARFTHQMYLACNLDRTFAYIPYGSTAYMCLRIGVFMSQYGEYSRAQVREIRGCHFPCEANGVRGRL